MRFTLEVISDLWQRESGKRNGENEIAHHWNTNGVGEKHRLRVEKGGGWLRNAAEIELCDAYVCVCAWCDAVC